MGEASVTVTLRGLGDIEAVVPADLLALVNRDEQKSIPLIAKDTELSSRVERAARYLTTSHRLVLGDCRDVDWIPAGSVHLVVTSPPYWVLKEYPVREGQLGHIQEFDHFLEELDRVWQQAMRVLVPGGRMVIVVGDVCVPRRSHGRHLVFPLHAAIQEHCRKIGFDNLAPIIWYKIANANFEVENGSRFLGKPYEPNAIVKNDIEYILFQRKPGGYRKPSLPARVLSVIPEAQHKEWFQQIWRLGGSSTRQHPAPYPLELAQRLVRMFSFVGDTVLDPFMGTGTTNLAAGLWGRNSIGIELEPEYYSLALGRLEGVTGVQMGLSEAGLSA